MKLKEGEMISNNIKSIEWNLECVYDLIRVNKCIYIEAPLLRVFIL